MSRYLLVDVGAGTMDILYFDSTRDLHYKAVVRSPVRTIAEFAESLPGNLLADGCEMGGGPISTVLIDRARSADVVMTASAALTLSHNLEKVRSYGIRVIDDTEAEGFRHQRRYSHLTLGDIEPARLEAIVRGFGAPFAFDVVGVCAQDHGMPPEGCTHLDYRHRIFKEKLDTHPHPHDLLYEGEAVPPALNRLGAIAQKSARLPADRVYVMDSGMAAILGASMDMEAVGRRYVVVMDVATSHTLGAALTGSEIAGFFEYHTKDITRERLESLVPDLTEGRLVHKTILDEGGHGAYTRKTFGFGQTEAVIATGPKRKILQGSRLPVRFGAPWGDNMLTGTVGLLEAIRRRKGLGEFRYL